MFHFHIPVEGIAHGISSIIKLWRGERATGRGNLFSDPAMARRDRIWRCVLAVIVTLGFLLMLALPVWLFIKAFSIPPPPPEQILQRREQISRRAVPSRVPRPADAARGSNAAPVQP